MAEDETKLTRKKIEWAAQRRGQVGREEGVSIRQNPAGPVGDRPRLPPGQHLAKGFPVLDLGIHPEIDRAAWRLQVRGLVENPVVWSWDDLLRQPQIEDVSDFHCVTSWSVFDNRWGGVSFRHLLSVVRPSPEAAFVTLGSSDGYTTNLPLSVVNDTDVLIAHIWNGEPLTREHGGPVRLVVPKRYGWKSAKWLKEIEFRADDRPGYWEVRGYANGADPWTEDRYG